MVKNQKDVYSSGQSNIGPKVPRNTVLESHNLVDKTNNDHFQDHITYLSPVKGSIIDVKYRLLCCLAHEEKQVVRRHLMAEKVICSTECCCEQKVPVIVVWQRSVISRPLAYRLRGYREMLDVALSLTAHLITSSSSISTLLLIFSPVVKISSPLTYSHTSFPLKETLKHAQVRGQATHHPRRVLLLAIYW